MTSLSTTRAHDRPGAAAPVAIRSGFLLGLAVLLAGGALAFSLLGYLETRRRLDWLESAIENLSAPHSAEHYRREVARQDAARFANAELTGVESFRSKQDLLSHALRLVDPGVDGLIAEFGVFRGSTINHIARRTQRTVHGFDSFEGLPEKWREGFDKGAFQMDGLPKVRENVTLHKGWFDATLPGFRARHPEPVAFLHMDADLYSSTRTVLDLLADRLQPGTVIVFDEFLGYPGWQEGEFRAFHEFVEEHDVRFEYVGWVPAGEQVAVRIESIGFGPGGE